MFRVREWLRGPNKLLWACALSFPIVAVFSSGHEKALNEDILLRWQLPLVLSAWILSDARHREKSLCYDYATFIFFAWPILVPIYLFQTRRSKAVLTLLCFAGILVIALVEYMLLIKLLFTSER